MVGEPVEPQKLRHRFTIAAIAATYMRPHWGRNYRTVWRSRIADRYNAPRSVSRVRSGFRDDDMDGAGDLQLPQCCLPPRPKVLKLGRAKMCGNENEIADSSLRNAPRSVSRASTSFRDDYVSRDQQGIYTKKATSNEVAFSNSVMNYYFFVNAS